MPLTPAGSEKLSAPRSTTPAPPAFEIAPLAEAVAGVVMLAIVWSSHRA
jgi:hypothetical protein